MSFLREAPKSLKGGHTEPLKRTKLFARCNDKDGRHEGGVDDASLQSRGGTAVQE